MSRLELMRLHAAALQYQEPADLLKVAKTMVDGGGRISAAAARALAEQKNFERQAIIRRRIS